jgi:hypothetical protein
VPQGTEEIRKVKAHTIPVPPFSEKRMTTEHKSVSEQPPSLTLLEILNIASSGYPDDFLKEYYSQETGKINEQGSGDTLAEFIVREIVETYDPDADKDAQVTEVCRVLRNGISDLEKVIAAVELAQRTDI